MTSAQPDFVALLDRSSRIVAVCLLSQLSIFLGGAMFQRALRLTQRLHRTGRTWAFLKKSALPSLWRDRHRMRPIFVMSPAGSGSTWIAAMLGHLPRHVFVHEVKICGGVGGKLLQLLQVGRRIIPGRLLFVYFAAFQRAQLWTLDAHSEHLNHERPELLARENLKDLELANPTLRHWDYDLVDSAGSHIAIAPLLRKAYPNAILCFVVRDLRDVCASIKFRKPFGKDVPIHQLAKVVLKDYAKLAKYQAECQIEVLRYESWLCDTDGELRAFVQRQGLELSEELQREAVWQHSANAMRAGKTPPKGNLHAAQPGGWSGAISPEDKASLKPILGSVLIDLGYESSLNW